MEVEVEDKGIVLTNVRAISLVLKRVVEESHSTANHYFGIELIGKADAGSKILLLHLDQTFAVFIALQKRDPILGQQVYKARRQASIRFSACRDEKYRGSAWRAAGNEICLAAIRFLNRPEVVIAKAQIECELRRYLPVILEICGEIILQIVGFVDVGGLNLTCATNEIKSTNRRRYGGQQELRAARCPTANYYYIPFFSGFIQRSQKPGPVSNHIEQFNGLNPTTG